MDRHVISSCGSGQWAGGGVGSSGRRWSRLPVGRLGGSGFATSFPLTPEPTEGHGARPGGAGAGTVPLPAQAADQLSCLILPGAAGAPLPLTMQ